MKDKDKLNRKRHHKNLDGTKNRLRHNRHKHVSQLDKDRQLSRDKRREYRNIINDILDAQLSSNSLQVLFVLDETENNEKILVSKNTIKDNLYSLELPTFTSDDLNEYINLNVIPNSEDTETKDLDNPLDAVELFQDVLKEFFKDTFDIEASEVTFLKDKNLVVAKGITKNESYFKKVVVRTYNDSTWFNCNTFVNFGKVPFYKGSQTDIYFASSYDLGNVLVSACLLYGVLDYRVYAGKLETYRPYVGKTSFWTRGTMDYFLTYTDPIAMERLHKEEKELKYLLFGKEDGKIIQDINKFVDFQPVFEEYAEKIANELNGVQSQQEFFEYLIGKKGSTNEYSRLESEYFSRSRTKQGKSKK